MAGKVAPPTGAGSDRARLRAIERSLSKLVGLEQGRAAREEQRASLITPLAPLISPLAESIHELELLLPQLYELARTQNQAFMRLTEAIRQQLAAVRAAPRAKK